MAFCIGRGEARTLHTVTVATSSAVSVSIAVVVSSRAAKKRPRSFPDARESVTCTINFHLLPSASGSESRQAGGPAGPPRLPFAEGCTRERESASRVRLCVRRIICACGRETPRVSRTLRNAHVHARALSHTYVGSRALLATCSARRVGARVNGRYRSFEAVYSPPPLVAR